MKNWLWIRSLLTLMITFAFLSLENAVGVRFYALLAIFFLVVTLPLVRGKLSPKWRLMSILIDLTCLIGLSLMSRYVVNYYVYILMMVLIVETGLQFDFKQGRYMIALIMLATLYNYGVLFFYRSNQGTLSEIFFMLVINLLIIFNLVLIHQNRMEKEKQKSLNDQLVQTNNQLENLTRVAVKNNIARDIHDTFGHDMMALIMEIEMAGALIDQDKEKAKELIKQAKTSAREGMKTIRKVVETLRNEEDLIQESIESLILNFKTRLDVQVDYSLAEGIEDGKVKEVLYRVIQEAMTNSIRHGKATHLEVTVKKALKTMTFEIKDNGLGSDKVIDGYGLKGMKERVESLGGRVEVESKQGFVVRGYIEVDND